MNKTPKDQSANNMEQQLKRIKVADIMSKFAITAKEDTTAAELAHLMMRFKISGIPIINEYEEIIGIVTATDLFDMLERVTKDIEVGYDPTDFCNTPLKNIMTSNPVSIKKDQSLFDVVKLMSQKKIHTLPVMEGNDIVGIIGRRDVIDTCFSVVSLKTK